MHQFTQSDSITIHAPLKSYIALSTPWILLTLGYLYVFFDKPAVNGTGLVALLTGTIALSWWIWLRGFRITVSDGYIEYRNGFFRSSKASLVEIASVKNKYIEWKVIAGKIKIPQIVVTLRSGEVAMLINPKPFGRDLQTVLKILKNCRA